MNVKEIVDAWESKLLPQDIETLSAWKMVIDRAEQVAFQAWRNSTSRAAGEKLIDDHLLYHIISIDIKQKISELTYQNLAKLRGSLF